MLAEFDHAFPDRGNPSHAKPLVPCQPRRCHNCGSGRMPSQLGATAFFQKFGAAASGWEPAAGPARSGAPAELTRRAGAVRPPAANERHPSPLALPRLPWLSVFLLQRSLAQARCGNGSLSIAVIAMIAPDQGVAPMQNWIGACILALAPLGLSLPCLAQGTDQGIE